MPRFQNLRSSLVKGFTATGVITFVFLGMLLAIPARASVITTDILPSWNMTAVQDNEFIWCEPLITYTGEMGFDNTLFTSTESPLDPNLCNDIFLIARSGLTFDLTSIPSSVVITKVEAVVTVKYSTLATQNVRRASTDSLELLNSTTSELFNSLAGVGPLYGSFSDWGTAGLKTLDLGNQAVIDIQQRLLSTKRFGLSLTANGEDEGAIYSAAATNPANRPALRITYSLYPAAPTGLTLTGRTATSLSWTWIDQATAETSNILSDGAQITICSTAPISGTGNQVSCVENGLSPNTTYTRHATAIDPEGSTNGADLTVSTAIETPTGVSVSGVGQTSASITALGTLSNLKRGFSGINFVVTNAGLASGWTQINSWGVSALQPNTSYTFSAQARNGDGVETPFSNNISIVTLARDASVSPNRLVQTWYNHPEFKFTNTAGWGSGGIQYYRYVWTTSPAYNFNGSELTWSTGNSFCPGGQCTSTGETMTRNAIHDGTWYLHVQPFNAENLASGTASYGPFWYDGTAPATPANVSLTDRGNTKYTNNLTPLSGNWSRAADGLSGLREYQYAIGTSPSSDDVLGFKNNGTDTAVIFGNLLLRSGGTYYLRVRSVDLAGNISTVTASTGILANTTSPVIIDGQAGDQIARRLAGTRYNVDFLKSASGPALKSAQYAVYAKPSHGGRKIITWTTIFSGSRSSITADWVVKFGALVEGVNYVSVRTTALDGLTTIQRDVFTITKDTTPAPTIKGLNIPTFSKAQSTARLLVLGRNFKTGAKVAIGSLPPTSAKLNKYGQLVATVSIKKLPVGRYSLHVINPNGLTATGPGKIYIIPATRTTALQPSALLTRLKKSTDPIDNLFVRTYQSGLTLVGKRDKAGSIITANDVFASLQKDVRFADIFKKIGVLAHS